MTEIPEVAFGGPDPVALPGFEDEYILSMARPL
jgi:hypothetical protein